MMSTATPFEAELTADAVTRETIFHTGLNVSDLEKSVRFYETLFGAPASRHYGDYARFEIQDPPLALALYPSPQAPGGALNHLGLRYRTSKELVQIQRRLEQAGIPTQRQNDVECCYSRQTKFWVTDPDRNLWEIYTLHEDLEHSGFVDPPAPGESVSTDIWEHRLTEPIPSPLPFGDESLDEVRLEGTFNLLVPAETLQGLLVEAYRALRPLGRIVVHGLVSDRPFPGPPKLPGIAALVQRVPLENEPAEFLRQAGFVDLYLDKQGDIHCFQVAGVQLRELRVSGTKPAVPEKRLVSVIYKGPFAEVTLDDGTVLPRGAIVPMLASLAGRLTTGPSASSFGLLLDQNAEG